MGADGMYIGGACLQGTAERIGLTLVQMKQCGHSRTVCHNVSPAVHDLRIAFLA